MRFKDKFIVVSEAPWRGYDQIEMDIFPSSISLTHNLYRQFKVFIFESYYNNKSKQNQQDKSKKKGESKDSQAQQHDRKYQLLVPSKALPKSKGQVAGNPGQLPIGANDENNSNDSKASSLGGHFGGSEKLSNKSGSKRQTDLKNQKLNPNTQRLGTARGLDGKFNTILDEVAKRGMAD